MGEMSGRERLLSALRFQPTDIMPWSPLIDDYFITSLPKQGYTMELIEAMRFIGIDILERHVPAVREIYKNGVIYREEMYGTNKHRIFETPVGMILETRPTGISSFAVSKHFIESMEDLKVYQYIAENTYYEVDDSTYQARDAFIGVDGLATPTGPMSPIQELLQFGCGIENTVYYMEDHPNEMKTIMQILHERNLRHYSELAKSSAEVIFDYEDTSTTVMSRKQFVNFSVPAVEEYSKIIRESGKLFFTHMCGKLSGLIDQISSMKVHGIDSVCPPTTGDLQPWTAREAWGKSKVILGGIEPPSLVFMNTHQTLETVERIVLQMEDKAGFVLSTGDAVPHGTPINNLIAITKYIKKLGAEALEPNPDKNKVRAALHETLTAFA